MKYGYARVATKAESSVPQVAALKRAGCKTVFVDTRPFGAVKAPAARARYLKALEPGDTLVVCELEQLATTVDDLVKTLIDLRYRKIRFQSLTGVARSRAVWAKAGKFLEPFLQRQREERIQRSLHAKYAAFYETGRRPRLTREENICARETLRKCGAELAVVLYPSAVFRSGRRR